MNEAIFKQLQHFFDHQTSDSLQLCMMLGLLVHDEVSTLELPQCDLSVRSNSLAFERLWQKVAERASGSLRRLTSTVTMCPETPFVHFFFNNLGTFSNLRELDVHYFFCDDKVFELFSQNMPQLT